MTDENQGRTDEPAEETPTADTQPTSPAGTGETAATEPTAAEPSAAEPTPEEAPAEQAAAEEEYVEETPRVKPEIPGMDLEVDIVREGEEVLREDEEDEYGEADADGAEEEFTQPIADAAIDLAAGARYAATGKRKTAVARVILKPGTGAYLINGRELDAFFPRPALQRTIRTALETVGLEEKIDVIATMHGGGVSAQAGALRHGISRALVDADPNLRSELKRRGFLTRDARVKERKKAGLKKARKRPQFSKR
jgi:small subunit ribosomal protein S9